MSTLLEISNSRMSVAPRGQIVRVKWQQQSPPSHEFMAAACPEEEGGFSIYAVNYPGVVSQGETLDEAKANIEEAFRAMLEAVRKHGDNLQFSHVPVVDLTADCVRLWIKVDG